MDPPNSNIDIMDVFWALLIKERDREKTNIEQKEKIYRNIYLKILSNSKINMRKGEKKNE